MAVVAAVMTGQGTGAIATIQLFGESAETVLNGIFRRIGTKPLDLTTGRILLGHIVDGDEIIDQVTIGCEGPHTFAVNCHGNPLIVERIMELLRRCGVELLTGEQLLARMLSAEHARTSIAVEAKLALTTVKTIEGARIIAHQVEAGLSQKLRQWRDCLDSVALGQIAAEAGRILKDSETARLIISGCTIALIGPANTGKSTLLNALAGREKALVTDIKGTTRDWVSAEIHLPPFAVTLVDTAGLGEALAAGADNGIDRAARRTSREILDRADLVLLVLDLNLPAGQIEGDLISRLMGKRIVVVLNKSDLPKRFDPASLPKHLHPTVRISAKLETGIEDLIQAIRHTCNLTGFNLHTALAFTARQRCLLEHLAAAGALDDAIDLVDALLHGPTQIGL